MEEPRLGAVEGRIGPREAAPAHQVHPFFERRQGRSEAARLNLEVGGQGDDELAPGPVEAQRERRGFAEPAAQEDDQDLLLLSVLELAQDRQGLAPQPLLDDEDELGAPPEP